MATDDGKQMNLEELLSRFTAACADVEGKRYSEQEKDRLAQNIWQQIWQHPDPELKSVLTIMRGSGRNKVLRKCAQVEYRCMRGCLLGAVFMLHGEQYLYVRQNEGVREVEVPVDELGEPQGRFLTGETKEEVREVVEYMYSYQPPVSFGEGYGDLDYVPMSPPSIDQMSELDARGDGETDFCVEWKTVSQLRFHTSDIGTVNFNCRHTELVQPVETIAADIKALRRSKKKVRYIDPGQKRTVLP